jgi:hypothetical protein
MASRYPTGSLPGEATHSARVEMDQAIKQLRALIDETGRLESQGVGFDDPKVDTVQKHIRETIREVFGVESPEYFDHSQHKIWHGGQIYLEARNKRQEKFIAGIPHTVSMLEGLIVRLEDRRKMLKTEAPSSQPEIEQPAPTPAPVPQTRRKPSVVETAALPRRIMTRRVCVIHGQNDALKNAVAEFLEKLGLEPVILHKQPNSDRSIIEKIESLPEVDYAVILLSADDFAQPGKPTKSGKPSAKRNVLLELGYYVGRLGKSRVCTLYNGHGKLPPDYTGICCISVNETQVWRRLLGLELQTAGFELNTETGE